MSYTNNAPPQQHKILYLQKNHRYKHTFVYNKECISLDKRYNTRLSSVNIVKQKSDFITLSLF